jgi:hypothetical protein
MKSMTPTLGVEEETTDDAIAAVQAMKTDKRIDAKQIYIIGHSQGAMLVPQMIEQDKDKDIAGAVIMAGPSGKFVDLVKWQLEQSLIRTERSGAPAEILAALHVQIEQYNQSFAMLDDPQYSIDHLPDMEFLQGMPTLWWFDWQNYRGPDVAKDQNVPLLILQGDNDIQVDKSQLEGWKTGLTNRKDVTYKLYEKLNHIFVPLDQPSTGAEYMAPGNAPLQVIQDIANWVKSDK